ncbi:putative Ig domain-containing protein [Dyadobacter sp. CY347]|uniref:putative Ig domain-containing protein n=1 Tax=Dyadobacter sp. CY347 TaxID=2909336 RepID=UPI001F20D3EE|nr:putative Ig domain-containing protein [Dyadobacter sp. CY347]MCF2490516.1 putative Ig domain-containing protein [Dyadobacter sp. CY347]
MHHSTYGSKLLTKLFFVVLAWTISFQTLHAQTNPGTTEADNQRYLALMLLNVLDKDEKGPELDLIRSAHAYGMNAVYLTIPWDKIYYTSPTDQPLWEKFDLQIKTATDLGMKVALRIHLGRHSTRIKNFWEPSDSHMSSTGKPVISGYQDTSFGFDNDPIAAKAQAFVKETVTRYRHLQTNKQLLFVSITTTGTQEGEYPGSLIENGKESPAVYDYSRTMITGFRQFLISHYKKLQRLNYLWGINHKNFEEVLPPATPWEPAESFRQRAGKDWYIYRHLILKRFTEQMIATVKSVDPNVKFVSDYGSVFDRISSVRGTLGFRSLNEKSDGIKINDDLATHDHRWSVDIIKSTAPANFIIANELFINTVFDNNAHLKQINENFAHGANMVAVVASVQTTMARSEPFLRQAAQTWLNQPMKPIVYTDSVSYRLSAAVEKSGPMNVVYDEWRKRAFADPNNPKPVWIGLNEDLLAPEYWDDASNYPPYVFKPVPMQIIAVNKDFAYKLPIDTFSDVDGTVVRMEVGALPAWLRFENGQLRGRPTSLGDYRIQVKGIDDEGGVTEAFLTVRVDTRENANKPPTVDASFSNQTIAVNEPFSLPINDGAFEDADGEVTKIEASELPSWLKYTNGVLTGTPPSLGEFRISLKAYDDLNAFVETYFTIKVVEKQFLNAPPYAAGSLPVKYGQLNMPFNYILPTEIFGDPDGYISSITLQNRPSWLNFQLNTFSGTPTAEGEYRLIIRAYDNAGAYVEVPFILIVEIPKFRFELVQGGSKVDQRVIRKLTGDEVIAYSDLPSSLNIYAHGNFEYDKVDFNLTGPYNRKSQTKIFPFALYENASGFAPYIGRYTLTVTATKEDSAIVTNSIQFSISFGDSINITKDLEDWRFFPNPVESVFNVKLPANVVANDISYELITVSGKRIDFPKEFVTVSDDLSNIDLSKLGISSGIYFIRLHANGELLKQFKIFKK